MGCPACWDMIWDWWNSHSYVLEVDVWYVLYVVTHFELVDITSPVIRWCGRLDKGRMSWAWFVNVRRCGPMDEGLLCRNVPTAPDVWRLLCHWKHTCWKWRWMMSYKRLMTTRKIMTVSSKWAVVLESQYLMRGPKMRVKCVGRLNGNVWWWIMNRRMKMRRIPRHLKHLRHISDFQFAGYFAGRSCLGKTCWGRGAGGWFLLI